MCIYTYIYIFSFYMHENAIKYKNKMLNKTKQRTYTTKE